MTRSRRGRASVLDREDYVGDGDMVACKKSTTTRSRGASASDSAVTGAMTEGVSEELQYRVQIGVGLDGPV